MTKSFQSMSEEELNDMLPDYGDIVARNSPHHIARASTGALGAMVEILAGPCAEVDASGFAWVLQKYEVNCDGNYLLFGGPGGTATYRDTAWHLMRGHVRPWTVNLYEGLGVGKTLAEAIADVAKRRSENAL